MSAFPSLSDAVRPLILPPVNLMLLIAAGLLLARWHARTGRALGIAAALILLILCMPAGANLLVRPLEQLTKPLTTPLESAKAHGAQAIVVLAAGRLEHAPEYGNADIPDYIALARLRYAARLQHETGLPLLVSGGNAPDDDAGNNKARAMAEALRQDFVTPVKWVEGRSENTAENASLSAAILQSEKIDRIMLVTDAMHMPRAEMAFAHAGFKVTAAPTMFFGSDRLQAGAFIPSAEGLRRAYYASYEWIGLLWYHLRPASVPATATAS
ncbi:YdcF family protein [Herbaspirillum lusitanum]|uniref:YdcF family protein n=1 Tax=Herbaspirillum lusitanum TaxID=213312 RepID=A0ABW9A5W1_9BURK